MEKNVKYNLIRLSSQKYNTHARLCVANAAEQQSNARVKMTTIVSVN